MIALSGRVRCLLPRAAPTSPARRWARPPLASFPELCASDARICSAASSTPRLRVKTDVREGADLRRWSSWCGNRDPAGPLWSVASAALVDVRPASASCAEAARASCAMTSSPSHDESRLDGTKTASARHRPKVRRSLRGDRGAIVCDVTGSAGSAATALKAPFTRLMAVEQWIKSTSLNPYKVVVTVAATGRVGCGVRR